MTGSATGRPMREHEQRAPEEHGALVQRLYTEIFQRGNLAAAQALIAPDFVDHLPGPLPPGPRQGPAAITWFASMYRAAFPDLRVSIDELMTCGDRVITRVTWTGTQTGPLLGANPTGKVIRIPGIDIVRIEHGQLVEHWGQMDVLGMLFQLGFLPGLE